MGQHRIQRQILKNFSFEGKQPGSRESWCLKRDSYRPSSRSIDRVGFFEVACSGSVDEYITRHEDEFKEALNLFGDGEFKQEYVGREVYDFIALHYVRSQGFRHQIEYMVGELCRNSKLTQPQAEAEYRRLTSHEDLIVFQRLVDNVASTLTHYVLYPVVTTGSKTFLTSDKIVYAGLSPSELRETFVWFPISPSTGLALISDGHAGQILGPRVQVNRVSGRISFEMIPEAPLLLCQEPSPQEAGEAFFNALNVMMVEGSTELFAADRAAIESAFRKTESPNGYRYQPLPDNKDSD